MGSYQALDSQRDVGERLQRDSGIPKPGGLGASRNELIGLVLGVIVLAAIAVGFWFEATR